MKFIGADIYAFYTEWPMGDSWYHDYSDLEVTHADGSPALELDKKYDGRELGMIIWQPSFDRTKPPPGDVRIGTLTLRGGESIEYDFSHVLAAWLKARAVATIVLEVPKDQVDEVKALAATRKWKVTAR